MDTLSISIAPAGRAPLAFKALATPLNALHRFDKIQGPPVQMKASSVGVLAERDPASGPEGRYGV